MSAHSSDDAPSLMHPADLAHMAAAHEHERADMKLKADGLGRYQGCAYDVKTENIVEASVRPMLEQALADHFLRLHPEAVMIDHKLFEHTVPKVAIDAVSLLHLRAQLNVFRRISHNGFDLHALGATSVAASVSANQVEAVAPLDVDAFAARLTQHELLAGASVNQLMNHRQEELQYLINLQRTHGTRQTLQAKAILKLLQMRDSLRAVRDRVVTAPAAASATAQIGSLPLCQSFFDPTLLHRAPSAAALLASYSKQEHLVDAELVHSSWQLNLSVPSHVHFSKAQRVTEFANSLGDADSRSLNGGCLPLLIDSPASASTGASCALSSCAEKWTGMMRLPALDSDVAVVDPFGAGRIMFPAAPSSVEDFETVETSASAASARSECGELKSNHDLAEWKMVWRESQEFSIAKALHNSFLRSVVEQHRLFKDFHLTRSKLLSHFAKMAAPTLQTWERRSQRKRINDMKAGNMDEYIAMIKQQKDERLNMVLNQTDIFLKKLGALVKQQQNATAAVSEMEEVGPDGKRIRSKFQKLTTKEKTAQQKREAESEAAKEMEAILDAEQNEVDDDGSSSSSSSSAAYYKLVHGVEEEIKTQPALMTGGSLKDYQIVGLQWMISLYNNNLNGILADEMGLGKTIQTISLFSHLIGAKQNNGPFLVIVPLTTLSNWRNEFEKWAPSIKVISYVGGAADRNDLYYEYLAAPKSSYLPPESGGAGGAAGPSHTTGAPVQRRFQVLLTTYEYVIHKTERPRLAGIPWQYMVVDEGHRLKNHHSKLAQILATHYRCAHRLLLTGTPLQNSLTELWALLNFLLPQIFNSAENFEVWFNKPFESAGVSGDQSTELQEEEKLLIIHRLHQVLRPFILRRMKKEVASQLPEKVERVLKCELSAWQKVVYNQISHRTLGVHDASTGAVSAKGLKNTLMQLRKVCNHPYLFDDQSSWCDAPISNEIIRSSGKFDLLDRLLPKLNASGHRVLLFTQMTRVLDVLEPYLEWRGWKYLRLDGSTKQEDRAQLIADFNAPDSPYFVFILSTRAGGLGLNLQTADTVVIFDSDWNPQMDVQAQDRAHRIGQQKEVRVLRFCTISPVEEHILRRAQSKLEMDHMVIKAGKFNKSELDDDDDADTPEQEREELASILRKGVALRGGNQDTAITDDEINEMLARSEEEFEAFQQMDVDAAQVEAEALVAAQAAMSKSRRGQKSTSSSSSMLASAPQSRLMTEDELPDHLRVSVQELIDEWSGAKQERNLQENYGKGRRDRTKDTYRELSDRQFEKWLEEGGDPADFIKTRNRKSVVKPKKRHARRARADDDEEDEDDDDHGGDENDEDGDDGDDDDEQDKDSRAASPDRDEADDDEDDDERSRSSRRSRRTRTPSASAIAAAATSRTRYSTSTSSSSSRGARAKRRRLVDEEDDDDDEPDDDEIEAALAAERSDRGRRR